MKRALAAVFAVFLIFGIVDFIFDFTVLMPVNMSLKAVWRPDAMRWLEPAIYLFTAVVFVILYSTARKSGTIGEGAIYGVFAGLLVGGILSFKQFALYPIPLNLAVIWFLESMAQFTPAGVAAAMIYGRAGQAR